MSYDSREQGVVLGIFTAMLNGVTKDGGKKRQAGLKPPWWRDASHEAAMFSHINKWKHGEKADADSGAHPLVHLAWRALAIAYQETKGQVDPMGVTMPVPEGFCPFCSLPTVPDATHECQGV